MARLFGDRDFTGMVGSQLRGQAHMVGNDGRGEAAKVFRVHAGEKVVQNIGGDILAERRDRFEQRLAIGLRSRHRRSIPEPVHCARRMAPV